MPSILNPAPRIHPVTGCRVDMLFGGWLCDPDQVQVWVDVAWTYVEGNKLETLVRVPAAGTDEGDSSQKLYTVDNGIAHITMSGPITKMHTSFGSLFGGVSTMEMRGVLKECRLDPSVKAILIHADSPGGTLEGTAELAAAIRRTNQAKPVYVHAEDKACSGMLWLATQGKRFTAGPSASVGSLGIYGILYDRSKAAEQTGVKPVVLSIGKFKAIGAPGTEITKVQQDELLRMMDHQLESFRNDVFTGRGLDRKKDEEKVNEILTARVFIGEDAKRVGLIDAVCMTDQVIETIMKDLASANGRTFQSTGFVKSAGIGSKSMLTEQELAQVQALPGMSNVTADNGVEALITKVKNPPAPTVVTKAAETINPKLAAGFAKVYVGGLDLRVKEGKLTAAQAGLLKAAVLDEKGEAIVSAFDLDGNIRVDTTVIEKVFDNNVSSQINTPLTAAQPAARVEPGEQDKNKKDIPTKDRLNSVRQGAGLEPLTEEQYQATIIGL